MPSIRIFKGMEVYHRTGNKGIIIKVLKSYSGFDDKQPQISEILVEFEKTLLNGVKKYYFKPDDFGKTLFFSKSKAIESNYAIKNKINEITFQEKERLQRNHRFSDETFNCWVDIFKFVNSHKLEYGFFNNRTLYLRNYHPRYKYKSSQKNPYFDDYDQKVLNLKDNHLISILYFANILNDVLAENITICYVPPSAPEKKNGMYLLSKAVANLSERFDAVDCIIRTKQIEKLATGGSRDISVHLKSLNISQGEQIYGKEVLLLDDILTTGNSIIACNLILLIHGAKKVNNLVLGKTSRKKEN